MLSASWLIAGLLFGWLSRTVHEYLPSWSAVGRAFLTCCQGISYRRAVGHSDLGSHRLRLSSHVTPGGVTLTVKAE